MVRHPGAGVGILTVVMIVLLVLTETVFVAADLYMERFLRDIA
jgi:hypothetical protein